MNCGSGSDMLNEFAETLSVDRRCRQLDSPDSVRIREQDIYKIHQLEISRWNDLVLPTLYDKRIINNRTFQNSNSEILSKLIGKFRFLKTVDLKNILIAGGSVLGALCDDYYDEKSDIDLFFCRIPEYDLNSRLRKFLIELNTYLEEYDNLIRVVRSEHAITIIYGPKSHKIQIVLRSYKTPSEVLHGFDIGCCAVGIWEGEFITTTLGKFALKYGLNIFDLSRRSTSYEYRILVKYAKRGFGVIMENLNIYGLVEFQTMSVNKHLGVERNDYLKIKSRAYPKSDYDGNFGKTNNTIWTVAKHGLRSKYFSTREVSSFNSGILVDLVFDISYYIPADGTLREFYSKHPVIYDGKIFINRIRTFFPDLDKDDLLEIMQACLSNSYPARDILDKKLSKYFVIRMKALYSELKRKDWEPKWLIENPGQQLTGSFHPLITSPKEWFGEHYIEL